MLNIIEMILGDDFVPYNKVYELAAEAGLSKSDVRKAKLLHLGIKTITLVKDDERLWLWYIPENVWKNYSSAV
ncbi:hypothetical protein [Desulfosporosinus sp.]|uniref:hypothetical protein n=1 Tax=Desulfosporosinus sp. TaxID=157907 RepID=UPI0025C08D21|nr:hypothetical protein [Desulfosporosinus sp.]MBC2723236.1 hypothetical protein [Desulfosporosinus sp.]MBC2727111.1 hypothetical protein [Desulfosporosinus sp.]